MAKLSKDAKERIIISLTSQPVGQEVIDAIEGGKVLSGEGVPSSLLGANGDVYVNLLNGDFYDKANDSWSFISGGGGGPVSWGSISGTLSSQTDLQNALDDKVEKSGDTMTGPLNMSDLGENIQFSVYGLNATSGIEIRSDDQTTQPSGNVKLTTGDAQGADTAGSIYLTGGSNVDGNPANIILEAGTSTGLGVNGSIIFDSAQVVYLNQNPLGQVDAVNHNIINVADPISAQDAATKNWVEDMSAIDNVLFVSPSASLFGADGSLYRPYVTIAAALAVASNDQVIALLPGTYSESTVIIPNTLDYITIRGTSEGTTVVNNGFSFTTGSNGIGVLLEKLNAGTFTLDASLAANGLVNFKQVAFGLVRSDTNFNVFCVSTESVCFGATIAGGGNNFSENIIIATITANAGLCIFENSKFVAGVEAYGTSTIRLLDCELFGAPAFVNGNIVGIDSPTVEIDPASDALGSLTGAFTKVLLAQIPLSNITQSGANTGEVPAWDGSAWVPTDIIGATLESTGTIVGIKDASQVSIAVNDGTRTFTVAPVSGSYECYAKGKKLIISSSKQIVWSNTPGVHFFYIDENENLVTTTTFTQSLITEHVFLSMVYWDDVAGKHIIFANERHGINMGTFTHLYLHNTQGAQFGNGLKLVNFVVDGGGGSDTHAQFTANSGSIWDEDIKTTIPAQSQFPVFYRNTSGNWKRKEANSFPVIISGEEGYTGAGGRLPYNQFDGVNWNLTEVDNNKFVLVHVFGTNDMEFPIICIQGQNQYSDKTSARAGAILEIKELSGLPVLEFCPIGSVIFQTSNSYTNTPTAQIVSTADGEDYQDHRSESIRPGSLA